jgi:protein NUD1
MDHAWLDSLSEDWVSQPSDGSAADLKSSVIRSRKFGSNSRKQENRISIPTPKAGNGLSKSTQAAEESSRVLSERSLNDVNIPSSVKRAPSKLSQEIKLADHRGRQLSRTVSASTSGSVVHNTVQMKSLSASPGKKRGDTPEWRRRLIHGNLAYGEHKDLFSSAGTGLENMFKPPPQSPRKPQQTIVEDAEIEDSELQAETSVPSSPPAVQREFSDNKGLEDQSAAELPPQQEERPQNPMRYRLQDDGSASNGSRGMSSRPSSDMVQDPSSQSSDEGSVKHYVMGNAESRKVSGQSVLQHEDLSPIILSRYTAGDGKAVFTPAQVPADQLRQKLDKLRRNQMMLDADGGMDAASFRMDNTEQVEEIDNHINFRRGGRSADGSFQHRLLSSALQDTSGLLSADSIQASTPKQFPTVKIYPDDIGELPQARVPIPAAPFPSPEKEQSRGSAGKGSPLKLFGPYDTFTNQTLLRRISQFEEQTTDGSRTSGRLSVEAEAMREGSVRTKGFSKQATAPVSATGSMTSSAQGSRNVSYFGAGHLDGFRFNEDMPLHVESILSDDEAVDADPRNDQSGSPDDSEHLVVQRLRLSLRQKPVVLDNHAQAQDMQIEPQQPPQTPTRGDTTEGKRPRTSPSKDPTPKRRRTLHKTDIAYGLEGVVTETEAYLTQQQVQSLMGKKRKDARPGDIGQAAEADVLASRQILRPRAPTPSQRSSVRKDQHPFADEDDPDFDLTPEFGESSLLSDDGHADAQRKPSIKTEDFIDQANQIMKMIRMKAGRVSDLEKLDESDGEAQLPQQAVEDSFEESTKEPFDRPPSREGGGRMIPRLSNFQENPDLLRYLKQYEEQGDTKDIISSSIRSLLTGTANAHAGPIQLDKDHSIISDPPNIRISGQPRGGDSQDGGYLSNGSSNNSGSSGRSIPTGSSRGSDSRKTIAPETVSHLIPEQVGVMVFDKQRNMWVKTKVRASPRSKRDTMASEASEDDPFHGIPDLTVDMSTEFQRLGVDDAMEKFPSLQVSRESSGNTVRAQAGSAEDLVEPMVATEQVSVRITRKPIKPRTPEKPTQQPQMMAEDEVVDHEISIHEDRVSTSRRRNLTISFSSPIASIIEDVVPSIRKTSKPSPAMQQSSSRSTSQSRRPSKSAKQRPVSVGGSAFMPRPVSRIEERDEDSSFLQQPTTKSRELSIIGDMSVQDAAVDGSHKPDRHRSLSFVISTPARAPACPADGADAGAVISHYVGMLSLSPLSDFTAHPPDQSMALEASYTLGNHHLTTADGKKRTVPLATAELVGKLGDAEPFEPYWQDLQTLDLHDSQLSNVQMLDEFCGSLVRLDASRNALRHLTGLPSTIRELKISHNVLSDLTSWAHLMNLQYVDVSNNGLTNLSAFRHLVHLRILRADNNQITNLDGVKYHDGLQVLRARGNLLEEVDFDGSALQRLTELDLKGNKLRSLRNVGQLQSLTTLKLEKNQLAMLDLSPQDPCLSLRYLNLSDNKLTSINIENAPSLRLLHADRNCITKLSGFSKARRLDSLSLREQHGTGEGLDLSFLSSAYEVRKLYLSGNLLENFAPKVDFLNLQLLELANCGLRSLPEDLGQMMPNLRVVNLNSNALSSLEALRFIPRLKRLLAAGNRLSNAATVLEVVAEFPYLACLDLRENPITQGFYPLPVQQVIIRHNADESGTILDLSPFNLPDADVQRDVAFASRLDMETAMRRRIYEHTFRGSCGRLRKLDGLPLRGRRAEERMIDGEDKVWLALVREGLIVDGDGNPIEVGEEVTQGIEMAEVADHLEMMERSARWEAENSFA